MAKRSVIVTLVAVCGLAAGAAAQGSFPAFWKQFRAAVARNDTAAIVRMTRLPFYLDRSITDRATLQGALVGLFDKPVRACLGSSTPVRDNNYYSVKCGQTVFGFDANEGAWQFSGINR